MSTLKVNTIRHTGASSDAVTLASDGTCTVKATNNLSNRNLIINGAMTVSQRGTSETGITGTWAYRKAPDRWFFDGTPSGAAFTVGQATEAPAGFANSYKVQCTTADTSLAADDSVLLEQKLEGQDLQHLLKGTSDAKKLVLSFYLKTSKTGVYVINLGDIDNSRRNNKSITVSNTNWNRYTLVFEGDTTGALDNNNDKSLNVILWLAAGTNYEGTALPSGWHANNNDTRATGNVNFCDSTSNILYFTGVQLEVDNGSGVASDFEHRSYGDELLRCQRYFYNHVYDTGTQLAVLNTTAYVSGTGYGTLHFPTTMRANPTLVSATGSNMYIIHGNGGATYTNAVTLETSGQNAVLLSTGGSMTQGYAYFVRTTGDSSGIISFAAEL